MRDIIIIFGPTAVGKSGVAVELARFIDGEVISADSMQIYKGLNIGTGKITNSEMKGIKHHLIDIKNVNEDYSVANFVEDATKCINDILARDKTPIIVGGTGMYIKALICGYNFGNLKADKNLRQELSELSNDDLYKKIKGVLLEC